MGALEFPLPCPLACASIQQLSCLLACCSPLLCGRPLLGGERRTGKVDSPGEPDGAPPAAPLLATTSGFLTATLYGGLIELFGAVLQDLTGQSTLPWACGPSGGLGLAPLTAALHCADQQGISTLHCVPTVGVCLASAM